MESLDAQSLLGLGSLKILDMSFNKISELPEHIFQWLGSLKIFNISFNFLSDAQYVSSMLETFSQLESLNLAGNQFNEIPILSSLTGLKKVDLSKNRIPNLPSGKFDSLIHLKEINLNGNQITWIDGNVFTTLKSLQVLDLRKGSIA